MTRWADKTEDEKNLMVGAIGLLAILTAVVAVVVALIATWG